MHSKFPDAMKQRGRRVDFYIKQRKRLREKIAKYVNQTWQLEQFRGRNCHVAMPVIIRLKQHVRERVRQRVLKNRQRVLSHSNMTLFDSLIILFFFSFFFFPSVDEVCNILTMMSSWSHWSLFLQAEIDG